jgi:hypothetical protein
LNFIDRYLGVDMQNYWSKEDLANFDSSEVFKELETRIINTIKRAEILSNKITTAAADAEKVTTAAEVAGDIKALNDLAQAADNAKTKIDALDSADDPEFAAEEGEEGEGEDLTDEVIDELRMLAQEAIANNNIKLAYKIERTIDEILEQDVACE